MHTWFHLMSVWWNKIFVCWCLVVFMSKHNNLLNIMQQISLLSGLSLVDCLLKNSGEPLTGPTVWAWENQGCCLITPTTTGVLGPFLIWSPSLIHLIKITLDTNIHKYAPCLHLSSHGSNAHYDSEPIVTRVNFFSPNAISHRLSCRDIRKSNSKTVKIQSYGN